MKYKMEEDRTLANTFRSLQFDWCVEMYGYVFAAAELGINHQIMHQLQVILLPFVFFARTYSFVIGPEGNDGG